MSSADETHVANLEERNREMAAELVELKRRIKTIMVLCREWQSLKIQDVLDVAEGRISDRGDTFRT